MSHYNTSKWQETRENKGWQKMQVDTFKYNGINLAIYETSRGYTINNIDFYNFEKYIESKECDIFLFGHTHKKFAKEIGNTYVFNPGSLTRPRDSSLGSYLILEIKDKNNITYKFKTVEL